MSAKIQVLDHGYVQFIESWGSEESIIEAARMSTAKGFLGWEPGLCPGCKGSGARHVDEGWPPAVCDVCQGKGRHAGDEKLLRYLWENKHSTPFEFAGLTIEIQAPIFVLREWHRHRTQRYAERSARYTPLPDDNYVPTVERLMSGAVASSNRQSASIDGSPALTLDAALDWLEKLDEAYRVCERTYQDGLSVGVPKELARIILPVGRYTVMRASTDLRNWLGFAQLRLGKGAQQEIRAFATVVHQLLSECFPRTVALFDEGQKPHKDTLKALANMGIDVTCPACMSRACTGSAASDDHSCRKAAHGE